MISVNRFSTYSIVITHQSFFYLSYIGLPKDLTIININLVDFAYTVPFTLLLISL